MAYIDVANLGSDALFTVRLGAGLQFEASYKADTDTGDDLSNAVLRNPPYYGAALFMPLIATRPGFGDTFASVGQGGIDDLEIQAAIGHVWNLVLQLHPEVGTP